MRVREAASFIVSTWLRVKEARGSRIDRVTRRPGDPAGFARKSVRRALALSLLFHVVIVAGLILCAGGKQAPHEEMMRIFLVDEAPSRVAPPGRAAGGGKAMAAVPPEPGGTSRALTRKNMVQTFSPRSLPSPPPAPIPVKETGSARPAAPREAVPAAETTPTAPSLRAEGPANAGGAGNGETGGGQDRPAGGAGYGTGAGGAGPGRGTDTGLGGGPGGGQAAYLREHFMYIRNLIMKNLKYPPAARRLGWKGAVTVSFVVLEDGAAHDIRVIKSSGHDILDRAVVKTIQEIQPFPRPPAKAELTVPIVFRLEAAG